ncbi:hypothetical protein CDD82_4822 [Ophiocordyceps australis]|uniref:Uncharacterized protein n=1 Tax=Ophiocordyceps australis TaxID=1399860 RepID=A0A2C5Z5N0_9HYPO|nr:hypothetical protein CDD82_4822 [Ophiocordyceps australis]
MTGDTKRWDAAAQRDLCIAVFLATQEGRITYNWAKAHTIMSERGYTFTREAISQHFTKVILKDYKSRVGSSSGPSTPKTPKTSKKPRDGGSNKRKTPTKSVEDEYDDDYTRYKRERMDVKGEDDVPGEDDVEIKKEERYHD